MHIMKVKECCPLCKGDVQGNPEMLFFCKKCNILYRTEDLQSKTFKK